DRGPPMTIRTGFIIGQRRAGVLRAEERYESARHFDYDVRNLSESSLSGGGGGAVGGADLGAG
ncbi:MAG TPA: hypothetical protein QF870_07685, partial [Nitrospinota bacterium]|nr:hypothetical protein [Nitrospinota bacterium]